MRPTDRNLLSQLFAGVIHGSVKSPPKDWQPGHGHQSFYVTGSMLSAVLHYRTRAVRETPGPDLAPWFFVTELSGHDVQEWWLEHGVHVVVVPSVEGIMRVLQNLEAEVYKPCQ